MTSKLRSRSVSGPRRPSGAPVSAPSAKAVRFKGWKSLEVSGGGLALVFSPEIGGRITGCLYKDKDLFYVDPRYEGDVVSPAISIDAAKQLNIDRGLRLYGGYKTWLAPQEEWPDALPYFELDSCPWEFEHTAVPEGIRVTMTSPACRESGVRIVKEATVFSKAPRVTIRQTMTNTGAQPVRYGLWDVTQLRRPARVFMPVKTGSVFEGGVKFFDVETPDAQKARTHVIVKENFAEVRCDSRTRFKVGTDAEEGWIVGVFQGDPRRFVAFAKRFDGRGGGWGHGASAEVFNSDETPNFEMEIHSPVRSLAAGESFAWGSRWDFAELSRMPETRADLGPLIGGI